MTDDERERDEVEARILGLFFGVRKPPRAKPHRCLGCGKVTRHVFCPATAEACRALYHERKRREESK